MIVGIQFIVVNSITRTKGDLINKSGQVLNLKGQYSGINKNATLINDKAINNAKFLTKLKGIFLDKGIFQYLLYRKLES